MASIFVIGAASLDTLHIQNQVHAAAGGAGLYTVLAASCAGADVTLFAPKPAPMPEALQPVDDRIRWIGPTVEPSQLPRLEIAHHGDGKATLMGASWGAVEQMVIDSLPDDLSHYDAVHIAALPSAQRQLDFLHGCRQRNASTISVGTYAKVVFGETAIVRQLLAESDLFFMNENEVNGLLGTVDKAKVNPGQTLFVTLDRDGAIIFQHEERIKIEGNPVDEIDPTGAGDTFCGATLAGMALGFDVEKAAQNACWVAAHTVQGIGPSGLLNNYPA